jgi:predicted aspartyl protease
MTMASASVALALTALVGATLPLSMEAGRPPGAMSETLRTAHDPAGRMTVATRVNGQGPFPFTIDTGANRSVISDRLAAQLGLRTDGTVMIEGLAGPEGVAAVHVDHMKAGSVEQHALDTAVLPMASLGSTGFLGTDMLANRSVVLDFKRHLITISRLRDYPVDEDSRTITIAAHGSNGQLVLTDATVNGIKVFAMIDTGAENSVGNPVLRRMLLGNKPQGPVGELIGVTGRRIPGEASSVPLVHLGKIDLGNMPIVYADPHTFHLFHLDHVPAILIGMDVLRKFNQVAIDFGRKEVRFNVSDGWNPHTLQALNRPRNEGKDDGGARLLARADQAGAGLDPRGDLLRD